MPLEPDRNEIEVFVDAIFRHASAEGFVAVRSFYESEDKVFRISSCPAGDFKFLVNVAEDDARRAAQFPKPIVFAPPLATFSVKDRARESDILEGLALSVECDRHPQEARQTLEELLGPATVVVRSGGRWVNGGDVAEDKLHLHWRLTVAARKDTLAKLKQARILATRLVGGDASNVPPCHPIRWPGSWHRKAEPRLCQIADADSDREIDLDAALAKLMAVAPEPPPAVISGDSNDWTDLVTDIVTGRSFHGPLTKLAARCIGANMHDGTTVNLLRSIMMASTAAHDPRWQTRYDGIARLVASAREKFGAATASLAIWNAGAEPPPPRGWLLGNSFCRRLVSALIAPGGAGKTALRVLQAIALASGRNLTGEHVFQRTRVLIISLEDDRHELERRILAARLHHHISEAELDGWLFLSAPGSGAGKLLAANPRTGALTVGTLAALIEAAVVKHGIGLVIIDPLIKAHAVNENSNEQMDALAQLLTDLAAKHNLAIDLPHHVSKGAAEPGNADRSRGASATSSAARLVYTLSVMNPAEAERYSIADEDRRDYVRLDRAKLNHARTSGPATWFHLTGVRLGNETPAYPAGDDVQTVELWTPPETFSGLDTALINQILTAIDAGPGNGNFYTAANAATDRAAWEVVCRFAPGKSEAQARDVIGAWLKTGLLVKFDYENPSTRKTVKGLRVDHSKRPS
jgi:hypothetical protein